MFFFYQDHLHLPNALQRLSNGYPGGWQSGNLVVVITRLVGNGNLVVAGFFSSSRKLSSKTAFAEIFLRFPSAHRGGMKSDGQSKHNFSFKGFFHRPKVDEDLIKHC